MVARIWQGKTKIEHYNLYTDIIEQRDLPGYKKTVGYVSHSFMKRSDYEFTYFKLITYWKDMDSVKNFTGPNFEVAVGYQQDEEYLLDFPGSVGHYQVFASESGR